ncbi:MAG: DUF2867 domain-containing protein [Fuerstiella sp.]|nr:DUF2867 domain-containing protein [Fuerstiella sp.]
MDIPAGRPGRQPGRYHPVDLNVSDTPDRWNVEIIDAPRTLRLPAEMKLPGRAGLQFVVTPRESSSEINQTAMFDPVGLFRICYWYSICPLHQFIFSGMLATSQNLPQRSVSIPVSTNFRRNPLRNTK